MTHHIFSQRAYIWVLFLLNRQPFQISQVTFSEAMIVSGVLIQDGENMNQTRTGVFKIGFQLNDVILYPEKVTM